MPSVSSLLASRVRNRCLKKLIVVVHVSRRILDFHDRLLVPVFCEPWMLIFASLRIATIVMLLSRGAARILKELGCHILELRTYVIYP